MIKIELETKEKGITLIALVITIIVLLILAGVSIVMLTGNNGILTQAQNAKKENEIAEVKERAKLDIQDWVADKLEKGEDLSVTTPEKVQEILNEKNPDTNNRYFKSLKEEGIETKSGYIIPYNEFYTKGSTGESKTVEDLVVGDKVYYDTGNTNIGDNGIIECIVLYDKAYNEENGTNYGVQIISADVIKNIDGTVEKVTLGVDDPTVTGSSDFEKAKNSYNNALKTLYDKAQEYLNSQYASGARCVGSDPGDPDWDTVENEAGYYTKEIAEQKGEYQSYMDSYYGTLKNEDEKYVTDWTQMGTIEGIKSVSEYYVLATRRGDSNDTFNLFSVRNVDVSGILRAITCCTIFSGKTYTSVQSDGFRPVFTLNSGIKIMNGDGDVTPYTLVK